VKKLAVLFAALGSLLSPSAAAENDRSSIVTGVVDAMGPSAIGPLTSQAGPNAGWIGAVTLVAWRSDDGPVEVSPLRIEHPLGHGLPSSDPWMASFRPRMVVKIRIAGEIGKKGLWPFAKFAEYLGEADDAELMKAADPILNPPDFVDADLGRFVADRHLPDSFNGTATWLGKPVDLTLSAESRDALPDCAATAQILLKDALRWQAEAEKKIVENLYQLWVDEWRPEGTPILSQAAFRARLTMPAITIYEGGAFEMEFGDGDLFAGHWILVPGSLEEGIEDAGLAG
jgi:hypothetical protein